MLGRNKIPYAILDSKKITIDEYKKIKNNKKIYDENGIELEYVNGKKVRSYFRKKKNN